jgi:hypothetical protein
MPRSDGGVLICSVGREGLAEGRDCGDPVVLSSTRRRCRKHQVPAGHSQRKRTPVAFRLSPPDYDSLDSLCCSTPSTLRTKGRIPTSSSSNRIALRLTNSSSKWVHRYSPLSDSRHAAASRSSGCCECSPRNDAHPSSGDTSQESRLRQRASQRREGHGGRVSQARSV